MMIIDITYRINLQMSESLLNFFHIHKHMDQKRKYKQTGSKKKISKISNNYRIPLKICNKLFSICL
jgi:hypothetical protein